jgi:hypothetical protein
MFRTDAFGRAPAAAASSASETVLLAFAFCFPTTASLVKPLILA